MYFRSTIDRTANARLFEALTTTTSIGITTTNLEEKPAWAKKDIRDYSEADLERLLDQWEVGNNTAIGKRHIGPNPPDSPLARE